MELVTLSAHCGSALIKSCISSSTLTLFEDRGAAAFTGAVEVSNGKSSTGSPAMKVFYPTERASMLTIQGGVLLAAIISNDYPLV